MHSLQERFGRLIEVRERGWILGPFGGFVIEPTPETIAVPESHTSGCVALDFLSTLRSQSLFLEGTKP
jgi:hypothetical protein